MKQQQRYKIPENIHFFALSITISYILKLFYSNARTSELTWILYPVKVLVTFFTGIHFTFDPSLGYFSNTNAISINQSCSGVNFLIIIMLLSHYSYIRFFKNNRKKMTAFLVFIISSYALTILVNAFRIITSVHFLNTLDESSWLYNRLHLATGIMFYFSFLLFYHSTLKRFFTKETLYEKVI